MLKQLAVACFKVHFIKGKPVEYQGLKSILEKVDLFKDELQSVDSKGHHLFSYPLRSEDV